MQRFVCRAPEADRARVSPPSRVPKQSISIFVSGTVRGKYAVATTQWEVLHDTILSRYKCRDQSRRCFFRSMPLAAGNKVIRPRKSGYKTGALPACYHTAPI